MHPYLPACLPACVIRHDLIYPWVSQYFGTVRLCVRLSDWVGELAGLCVKSRLAGKAVETQTDSEGRMVDPQIWNPPLRSTSYDGRSKSFTS